MNVCYKTEIFLLLFYNTFPYISIKISLEKNINFLLIRKIVQFIIDYKFF